MAQKIDHCSLPWIRTMAERQHDLKIHIKNVVVKAAMSLSLTHHHKHQEIRNMHIACDISRSLKYCESYPNLPKRTSIEASVNSTYDFEYSEYSLRKRIMRQIKKTDLRIVISEKESESNFGNVYIHKIWRWVQWDCSRDRIRSIAWRFSHCHENDTKYDP